MPETETIEALLKPTQAAKILNVSRPYVYKMAELGLLPCVRWPGTGEGDKTVLRFLKDDVLNFITEHRKE
jgi:excisionase family DNA binding protein